MEFKTLRDSMNSIRKGLFARHNDLSKKYIEVKLENDALHMELKRLELKVAKLIDEPQQQRPFEYSDSSLGFTGSGIQWVGSSSGVVPS